MHRRTLAVAAALLLLAAAPPEREPPRFTSQVELVTVDAVVLDRSGAPVRGLSAADFVLFEDGEPQEIASFEAIDVGEAPAPPASAASRVVASNHGDRPVAGRSFVLLVDDMSLAPTRQEDVRRAVVRFAGEGLRDGDELIFATSSGDAWWSARMPEGREDVVVLAGRVRGRALADTAPDTISEWEAFRITHFEGAEDGARGAPGSVPPQPGVPIPAGSDVLAPGSNLTERVRRRYLARGLCHPFELPAACYGRVRSRAQQVDSRRRNRTRDVMSVVDRAVFALTGVRGRKALVLLTEGFLNDSELGLVQQIAGRCREANVAVYSIDVRGLIAAVESSPGSAAAGEASVMLMEEIEFKAAGSVGLAEDTGGFALRNTNDLAGGALRAAEESRVHYLLGYAPPAGKSARDWRRVRVEVKRPGLTVRARKGYTLRNAAEIAAAAETRLASQRGQAPPVPSDVARALSSAHEADAIPLRAMAYVLEDRPGGLVKTLVAVEADVRALANLGGEDKPRASLSLAITAAHRDTGRVAHAVELAQVEANAPTAWDGWLVLTRAFDLSPGVNQARVVVRDEFLGRLGAVTLRFEVPAAGTFRIASPMMSVLRSAAGAGRPVLAARREFTPGGQLYCQYEVLGARDPRAVEGAMELRSVGGTVVRRSAATPLAPGADGRLVRVLVVPLGGLREGDYEMVIRAVDRATGATLERVEPLRIAARAS